MRSLSHILNMKPFIALNFSEILSPIDYNVKMSPTYPKLCIDHNVAYKLPNHQLSLYCHTNLYHIITSMVSIMNRTNIWHQTYPRTQQFHNLETFLGLYVSFWYNLFSIVIFPLLVE